MGGKSKSAGKTAGELCSPERERDWLSYWSARAVVRCLCSALFCAIAAAQTPPARIALIVGINKYQKVSGLNGAVNDALLMKDLLVSKYDFPESSVLVLTDGDATRDAIVKAFREHLIGEAKAGDQVVFFYAGHGSQIPNPDRPSGKEETIVPVDGDVAHPESQIGDGALYDLFTGLLEKTRFITAIFDSCHSGTAVRGEETVREVPPDPRLIAATKVATPVPLSAWRADRGIIFIAGARPDQRSQEKPFNGVQHGYLTYYLNQALRANDGSATWRDVMDEVRSLVVARRPDQEPQLEGAAGDTIVFGAQKIPRQSHYTVSGRAPALRLNAGKLHGVAAGSTFAVYDRKSLNFDAEPLALLEVTDVELARSTVKVVKGGPVAEGAFAIERQRKFDQFQLRVFVSPKIPAGAAQEVRAMLQRVDGAAFAEAADACDVQIAPTGDALGVMAVDGRPLCPPLKAASPSLVTDLERQVKGWVRWFQIAAVDNPGATRAITVKAQVPGADGSASPVRATLPKDSPVDIVITNVSNQDLHVSILNLGNDGAIRALSSARGGQQALAAGKSVKIELSTPPALPEGADRVVDVFKVFATPVTTAVDFEALASDEVRDDLAGLTSHPLGALLAKWTLGVRRDEAAAPVTLSDWWTASVTLVTAR